MARQKLITRHHKRWAPMLAACALLLTFLAALPAQAQKKQSEHGISMMGDPALPSNLETLPYIDDRAIYGGQLVEAKIGNFDNLNPFTIRGTSAYNLRELVFESLLGRNMDEPFALYGLLAEKIAVSEDRGRMQIRLEAAATFSDGRKVTPEDVIYSWQSLKDNGRPNHRHYYSQVQTVEKIGPRDVLFTFKGPPFDRELPLILGLMPILPKHIYQNRDLQSSKLDIPVGSGPYIVQEVEPGRRVTFEHDENHWGINKPINKMRYNFKRIIHDYYRDETSAFEAFKSGNVDIWFETNPLRWQNEYDFAATRDGRIIIETIKTQTPTGLNAFVMNTRRPIFSDQNTRKALDLLFDFEWINKVLYGNSYSRTKSYFGNTPLSASGVSASSEEKKLIKGAKLSAPLLSQSYMPPRSDGSGRDRQTRKGALELLAKAGFSMQNGQLSDANGTPLTFEILVQRRDHERLSLTFQRMLKQVGIEVSVRLVDASQYQARLQNFDFDMIIYDYYASLSPGNEQNFYWSSTSADTPGSRNYAGIKSRQIDGTIDALTNARDPSQFQTATRALDRLLMSGNYFIPLFHRDGQWLARWSKIERPSQTPIYGAQIDTWWASPDN